ncbi:hypothetical protein OAH28_03430 [Hyphomicrobiales bacterium]|nr:hypothetical protein [Hyphomicrobiales bacterium]
MKYVSFIANWVLGVLSLIVSLLAIINSSFVSGLFLLIASLTLMPISRRFVLPKINKKMSPMIRAALVSVLFIGFVVSIQPNQAQLLEQKELKLAEEAALVEQQKIAKAAGFLSVEEYKKAKSVEVPTKALYDTYLVQQAELKLNEEKLKAEQKRLTAEAEEKRKAEEAEKARLAVKAEEKRKIDEAEKARLAAIEEAVKRNADSSDKARLSAEVESDNNLIHNINNLGLFLRCTGFEGTPESNAVYWVGMSTKAPKGATMSNFRFPKYELISTKMSKHRIFSEQAYDAYDQESAFLFYYNHNQPDPFIDNMQYIASVKKTDSLYEFGAAQSVAAYSPVLGVSYDISIERKSGILKFYDRVYFVSDQYNCSPVSEADKEKMFTNLYRNLHNYAFGRYDINQKGFNERNSKSKF